MFAIPRLKFQFSRYSRIKVDEFQNYSWNFSRYIKYNQVWNSTVFIQNSLFKVGISKNKVDNSILNNYLIH